MPSPASPARPRRALLALLALPCALSACATGDLNGSAEGGDLSKSEVAGAEPAAPPPARGRVGDGDLGGYVLVSALIPDGCVAYPIGERAVVGTAECLRPCADAPCDIALMVTDSPSLLGLSTQVALSERAPGDAVGAALGVGVALLDRSINTSWRGLAAGASPSLSQLGEPRELVGLEGARGVLSPSGLLGCDRASVALVDEAGDLVGLSLGREGRCDELVLLSAHRAFLDAAASPGYQPPAPAPTPAPYPTPTPDPTPDPTPAPDPDPGPEPMTPSMGELEAEERAAEMRAGGCFTSGERVCDGDVELTCNGVSYDGFNCALVGWRCVSGSSWGASCEP